MKEIRILLVEDEEIYHKTFILALRFLRRFDFEPTVFITDNLTTALELLNDEKIDLVVTDGVYPLRQNAYGHGYVNPEYFRGNELAAKAKKLGVKVVGVSTEPERFQHVDCVFKKPIDLLEVMNKIVELLR